MTKRHFVQLADVIRDHNQQTQPHYNGGQPFTEDQIDELANFCDSQNPRFNRSLWLAYIAGKCGPSGGKLKKVA